MYIGARKIRSTVIGKTGAAPGFSHRKGAVLAGLLGLIFGCNPAASAQGEAEKAALSSDHNLLRPIIILTAEDQFAGMPPVKSRAMVTIDSQNPRQEIKGFGGAFTDASCYLISRLTPEKRAVLLQKLFGKDDLKLNFCRTTIGASDYSRTLYGYDEGSPDPELKRFSIKHDRAYIIPVLKEAMAVNKDIFLFSSPWSPPGWMKANKSMLGGSMRRQYMPSYASYFARFIKDYEKDGVNIQAVTVQNEVDTDQDGKMPACIWPQEYEVDFVRQNLAPVFKKEGIKTKIWIVDHNYSLWGRALSSLELPDLRDSVDAIAWHGYVGDATAMTRVHDAYPTTGAYWTEGGPDISDAHYQDDYCKWSAKFSDILNNWAQGICVWNLVLDEKGKPNIGPFPCGGLVTLGTDGKVVESGQYKALRHFAPYIARGARALKTDIVRTSHHIDANSLSDLSACAFINPDGSKVVVLTNSNEARSVTVKDGDQSAVCDLPANSIETILW